MVLTYNMYREKMKTQQENFEKAIGPCLMHPSGHLQGLLLGRLNGVGIRGGERGFMKLLFKPGRNHLESETLEREEGHLEGPGKTPGCRKAHARFMGHGASSS